MKIGVTGAAGHIGSAICRELLNQGHQVKALVYKDTKAIEGLPIEVVHGNVLDRASMKEFISGCDRIIHAAGVIELGYKFNQKMHETNVEGTRNIFEIAKEMGVEKIVHFSSVHVFDQAPHDQPVDETRRFVEGKKAVNYDLTKRAGHELALEYAAKGQNISIICPTAVIGPHDAKPSKTGVAVMDIYKGNIPASVKGGFDFVDVRDIAIGAISALDKGRSGEAYILGGEYRTIKQFGETILRARGSNKKLIELPLFVARIGLPFVTAYSAITKRPPMYDKPYIDVLQDGNADTRYTKAIKDLDYKPRPFEDTIGDLVKWFKENGYVK